MKAQRRTVLLVEDDKDIREAITAILEEAGYIVWSASNAKEALAKLDILIEARCPGAIVTDEVMPEISGSQLVREVRTREHCRLIPIIIMTASNVPIEIEGVPVIRKPFDLDAFVRLVDEYYSERDLNERI